MIRKDQYTITDFYEPDMEEDIWKIRENIWGRLFVVVVSNNRTHKKRRICIKYEYYNKFCSKFIKKGIKVSWIDKTFRNGLPIPRRMILFVLHEKSRP